MDWLDWGLVVVYVVVSSVFTRMLVLLGRIGRGERAVRASFRLLTFLVLLAWSVPAVKVATWGGGDVYSSVAGGVGLASAVVFGLARRRLIQRQIAEVYERRTGDL